MRNVLLALLLTAVLPTWVYAETLYVRPTADCANSGDGTAYACAASGGAPGAWRGMAAVTFNASDETAGSVDPGDTLKMCGNFVVADRDTANFQLFVGESGTANNVITFDGDCSADGGASTADFDGGTSTLYGFGPYDETYLTVKNLVIHDFTSRGILGYNHSVNDVTIEKYNTFSNITIYNIRGVSAICIDGRGRRVTYTNLIVYNCGTDGIFHNGANLTVQNNTISFISLDHANSGDGIQITGEAGGDIVQDNTIDMTAVDSKYCLVVEGLTDTGIVTVRRNTCVRNTTDTVGSGIRIHSALDMTYFIYSNHVTGGELNLQITFQDGTVYLYGNRGYGATHECISLGGSDNGSTYVWHNTCSGFLRDGILNSNTSATVHIQNNIVSGGLDCIDKVAANIESYNDLYGCANAVADQGVTTTVGTGTIITNPLFISTTDLRTSGNSPARRIGLSGLLCADVRGRPCYPDSPDIGAYQATSGDQANTRTAR